MPTTPPKSPKILLGIIIALVLLTLIWLIYFSQKSSQNQTSSQTSPLPSTAKKSASPTLSASPQISPSPTPTPSSPPNISTYKIPAGETYVISSQDDTNGDNKIETLVITALTDGKYHAYVLSSDGAILYDNKEIAQKPLRISLTKYNELDKNPSWMLVFTEESGSLALIRWNGQKYEIPQDNMGI